MSAGEAKAGVQFGAVSTQGRALSVTPNPSVSATSTADAEKMLVVIKRTLQRAVSLPLRSVLGSVTDTWCDPVPGVTGLTHSAGAAPVGDNGRGVARCSLAVNRYV